MIPINNVSTHVNSVLLPLSNFEITGMRREGNINVLEIQLNINLNAQKLEDLDDTRKNVCIDFGEELYSEIADRITGSRAIQSEDFDNFRARILGTVESQSSSYFLHPTQ